MEQDVYMKIESYLGNSMTLEEQKAFERDMVHDPNLHQEVQLQKAINHHLNSESWEPITAKNKSESQKQLNTYFKSEEAKELKQKLNSVQQKYNQTKKQPFPVLKYISSVAAVLLLVIASYFLLKQKSYEDLYVEYYNEKDLPSLVSRGDTNAILSKGVIAFKSKEYKEALKLINEYLVNTDIVNPLAYSYKGMTHLELNEVDKAIQSFDLLLKSNSIDRSKALWYKCLVYLKMKNNNSLKETLLLITENQANFNYDKAQQLLNDL